MTKRAQNNRIRLFLEVILLVLTIFLLVTESKNMVKSYIEDKIKSKFKGDVFLEDVKFSFKNFQLLKLNIYNVLKPSSKLLTVEKIEIPWSLFYHRNKSPVLVSAIKLDLKCDNSGQWNIEKNIIKVPSPKEDTVFPEIKIAALDSEISVSFPLNGESFVFLFRELTTKLQFLPETLKFFLAANEEITVGVSIEGVFNLIKQDLSLQIAFVPGRAEILAKNKFLQLLLPWINDFDCAGDIALSIIIARNKQIWESPLYYINLAKAQFQRKAGNWRIKDFFGELKYQGDSLSTVESKGIFSIYNIIIPFVALDAALNFTAEGLEFSRLKAEAFKGSIESKMNFVYSDHYQIDIEGKQLDLRNIAKLYTENIEPWDGHLFIKGTFSSQKEKEWEVEATGDTNILEGNLLELPLFIGIFDLFNFELPKKEKIKRVETTWHLEGGKDLVFDKIMVFSSAADFCGGGTVKNLEDLDLYFAAQLSRSKFFSIPLIGELTRQTSNLLFKNLKAVSVTGSLNDPKIEKIHLKQVPAKTVNFFYNVFKDLAAPFAGSADEQGEQVFKLEHIEMTYGGD